MQKGCANFKQKNPLMKIYCKKICDFRQFHSKLAQCLDLNLDYNNKKKNLAQIKRFEIRD